MEAGQKRDVALITALIGLLAVFALRPGFLVDDLALAAYGSSRTWFDIFSLSAGPFPFHVALWKWAAGGAEPYVPVRVFSTLLHGVNALLLYTLVSGLGDRGIPGGNAGRRSALWLAALFLFLRPGNEAILWACADAEVIALFFTLLSLGCWRRRDSGGGWRFLCLVCFAAAMLAKISTLLLPAVFAAWALWIEEKSPKEILRRDGLTIAAAFLLAGGLAANALANPGQWGLGAADSAKPGFIQGLAALGAGGLRVFTLLDVAQRLGPVAGFGALGMAVILVFFGPPRLRFGLIWIFALMAPSVMARGIGQPRYAYAASAGLLFALMSVRDEAVRRGLQKPVLAVLILWGTLNGALYFSDGIRFRRCEHFNEETRRLIAERIGQVRSAGELAVVNRSPLMRHSDILGYDYGLAVPVTFGANCPSSPAIPCLVYPRTVNEAKECPAEFPFARWGTPGS